MIAAFRSRTSYPSPGTGGPIECVDHDALSRKRCSQRLLELFIVRGDDDLLLCCEATDRRNAPYRYWLAEAEEE